MPQQSGYHAPAGRDFLGFRTASSGAIEIVYDDGAARHMVWRVQSPARTRDLGDALARAVEGPRVIPALYAELKKRAIAIEAVAF